MVVAQEGWVALDRERLLWLYDRMALIREFEERLKPLVETGLPVGAAHFYVGEEAVAVGVCAALRPDDWIASTHRGHGHCIAKGVDVRPMMAELYGKATGTNRGKGGSMHITDVRVGMLGVNPIVGMGAPHAVGAAPLGAGARHRPGRGRLLRRRRGQHRRGPRGAEPGRRSGSCPCVFVCENNGYAQARRPSTPLAGEVIADARRRLRACRASSSTARTCFAVYAAAEAAVERARAGERPVADRVHDLPLLRPLLRRRHPPLPHRRGGAGGARARLHRRASASRARGRRARRRPSSTRSTRATAALVDEAVAFAEAGPLPEPHELLTDVYVQPARAASGRSLRSELTIDGCRIRPADAPPRAS